MIWLTLMGCLSEEAILRMADDGLTAPEAAVICVAIAGTCWVLFG